MTPSTCVWRASILILVFLAGGCGDDTASTPAAPSLVTSPQPTPGLSPASKRIGVRLSGHVRDWDGMPVDQAIVKVRDDDLSPTVITDATGFYETALALDPRHFASWISIRREGYEDLENAAIFTNGQFATSDYVLFPKTTVTAGSTAPVRFVMNGPLCGFDLEYPCRHLTIVAPVSGTLVMETLGNSEAALYFGPIDHYPFVGATERSIPVTAGDKVPIELLWGRPTTRQTSAVVTEGTLVTRIDH